MEGGKTRRKRLFLKRVQCMDMVIPTRAQNVVQDSARHLITSVQKVSLNYDPSIQSKSDNPRSETPYKPEALMPSVGFGV